MLGFLKKLFGMPTESEKAAAKAVVAPYKVDPPKSVEIKVAPVTVSAAPAIKVTKAKKASKPKVSEAKLENVKEKTPKVSKPRAPRKPKVQS